MFILGRYRADILKPYSTPSYFLGFIQLTVVVESFYLQTTLHNSSLL